MQKIEVVGRMSWQHVDVLKFFPQVVVGGKILFEIDGDPPVRLTREDVLQRWAAYCDAAGDSPEKVGGADPKKAMVDAITKGSPGAAARKDNPNKDRR